MLAIRITENISKIRLRPKLFWSLRTLRGDHFFYPYREGHGGAPSLCSFFTG